MLRTTRACTFSTSQLPKVLWSCCVLYILASTRASRHNSIHFFDISTSKSRPNMRSFVHLDFQTCFGPQRRELLRHLNFQKWSENCVLNILTSKCASRHNCVQLFISHLAKWLRTRRFRAYFSTLWRQKSLEKHRVSRLSYLFAHLHLLSSNSFPPLLFIAFPSVNIVGSLTSKLPSMRVKYLHYLMSNPDSAKHPEIVDR